MDAQAKILAELDDDWSSAAVKKDLDKLASYYAPDAVAYPPNEPAAVGRAAARKAWAEMLADPSLSSSWKTSHAEVSASGEIGFTAGTYVLTAKGPMESRATTRANTSAFEKKKRPDSGRQSTTCGIPT